jgi:Uma2 family endonuclease
VREESPDVSVAAVAHHHYKLPDTPYNLWVRDELADHLHLPADGARVEVIGGEIVVSPMPSIGHNGIVRAISDKLVEARLADPAFQWNYAHSTDLNLADIRDGYVPDLMVMNAKVLAEAVEADAPHLFPSQVELVVEVTSPSNAANDRQPTFRRSSITKWNGYAEVGVPYYLLVDRAPRTAQIKLYVDPDRKSGAYKHAVTWEFGQVIKLPEPIGIEIPTADWKPWQ